MAEILIKAVDAVHADPEKDQRGCYKRGMPVVVMPDGHQWGASECLPSFVVLRLPGVEVERVQQFLAQEATGEGDDRVVTRRRAWRLVVDELPAAALAKFAGQGYVTIGPAGDFTWAQARNFIRQIADNALAPAAL